MGVGFWKYMVEDQLPRNRRKTASGSDTKISLEPAHIEVLPKWKNRRPVGFRVYSYRVHQNPSSPFLEPETLSPNVAVRVSIAYNCIPMYPLYGPHTYIHTHIHTQ